jgi:hypothetical protein
LLGLFSVLFVNCGDNIKVYFSIVTHEIPLRARKKPRRTQCTIRSVVNHLQNLFNVKTVSSKMFKFYSRSKTTTITNFILDEIKRSISISVYYGWKRSIKNGRWREIDLKIIFLLQISYSPHSGTNTKIKWDMCLCILNVILKYTVGTCLWLYWKLILNTHFLLDFIYFHETIDFSLTSVTSSHVQIWKIVTKIVVGVKVL